MFKCRCYNEDFTANTITEAKRKASLIANKYINPIDKMVVETENGEYIYRRFNKIYPWNEIKYGKWE